MTAQSFEDFKSKYLDIYDKVRSEHEKEKISILEDVDFELELIRRDEINVDYIIRLLAQLVNAGEDQKAKLLSNIDNVLASDAVLRSKRELIQKFIARNIPNLGDASEVEGEFESFWSTEKAQAFEKMCIEEGIMTDRLQKLIDDFLFTGRMPRRNELAATLKEKPKILERDSVITKISKRLNSFIETFVEGV